MNSKCRECLRALGLAAVVFSAFGSVARVVDAQGADPQAVSPGSRVGPAAMLALELDGSFAGWLDSAEGGNAWAEAVSEPPGEDRIRHKHPGSVKYEDISIRCGTGMSKAFYQWIKESADPKSQLALKSGAVVATDSELKEVSRREFVGALIGSIGLPALDGGAKEMATMVVVIVPEVIRFKKGTGAPLEGATDPRAQRKQWQAANFRLSITGLEHASPRVAKVDAITISRTRAGGRGKMESGGPAFSNLVISLAEQHAQSLYDWHEDFVIKGNSGPTNEREGTLIYMDPRGEAFFTLSLHGLGVLKVAQEKFEANSTATRRAKAELYCEQIEFDSSVPR